MNRTMVHLRRLISIVAFTICGVFGQAAHPLDQWTQHTVPLANGAGPLYTVAFGNGVFVAAGHRSTLLVSADGANWADTNPGIPVLAWRSVRFLNGQFTVVGHANLMLRSEDGVNWTTNLLPRDVVLDVAYGNGRYVIAGVSMFSSANGSDWLPITTKPYYDGFQSVVFADGKFIATFINVSNPSNAVVHSVDGQNWSLAGSLPIQDSRSPSYSIYENGRFVVTHRGSAQVFSSLEGTGWQSSTGLPADFAPWGSAAYGAGYFVTVGQGSVPAGFGFFSSTNAKSWQLRFPNVALGEFTPNAAAYGHGRFVVVGHGEGNANVYRSGLLHSPALLEINRYAGIKILGVPGRNYSIEAALDVAGPWQTLTNLLLPNNPHTWIDYDSPGSARRVYRAIEAPQPE